MDLSGVETKLPRSVQIRNMIREVEEALQTETGAQVASRFADYQKDFPKIFEMLLTRNYPRDIMEMMIRQFEKVEAGNLSQHNASVAVGTVLVDRFVKPQLKHAEKK
jgi:hypothetical protein